MKKHLVQAYHNQDFHTCINTAYPERFVDWKTTVLFYTALHLLKALAAKMKVDIGHTHKEIDKSINPASPFNKLRIKNNAYYDYVELQNNSRNARYDGIDTDNKIIEVIQRNDYKKSLQCLTHFVKYMESRGIIIAPPISPDAKSPTT